jgi:hypothetical protein
MASQITYVSASDTAKLIRADLKDVFTGVKFSVRTKSYSGGASIRVCWQDGPTVEEVETVTNRYTGSTFDGMQDLREPVYHTVKGKTVQYGASCIITARYLSLDFLAPIVQRVAETYRVPAPQLTARRSWDDRYDEVDWGERDFTPVIPGGLDDFYTMVHDEREAGQCIPPGQNQQDAAGSHPAHW